jgi:flagellar biosynthesis protein FlhG
MDSEPGFPIEEGTSLPAPPAGVRRIIAVGGGRGGVGKSVLAQSLAVYFAQLGKPVVLVDADPTGSNLHAHFGLSAGKGDAALGDAAPGAALAALVPTSIPWLKLLPAPHDAVEAPLALRAGRKARWLSRLRTLPVEYLVIDVGPGHGQLAVDLMLAADIAIAVTVPEPPAIEETYRFLRVAYLRRLRRALTSDRFRLGLFERALEGMDRLPAPIDLVRALSKMDRHLAEFAWAEIHRMRMHLVVNQTRVRTDLELGAFMCDLVARHYGILLDELGHVEHDDTVWLTVRRNKPLLIDSPASKAARNFERIARRVVAIAVARPERTSTPPPLLFDAPNLYAALGIGRSANDEEIRRAYKRGREMYATGGLATSSLLLDAERKSEVARLDEAYDTLLDAVRRRAYDLSTFPEPAAPDHASAPPKAAMAAEQQMLQNQLAHEIGPETEFTGPLLRKVRESHGVELADICAKTKISKVHLEAIEEEHFDVLPAPVYVRGFVAELAKFLRLDPPQVQRTFLRRMREGLAVRGRAP